MSDERPSDTRTAWHYVRAFAFGLLVFIWVGGLVDTLPPALLAGALAVPFDFIVWRPGGPADRASSEAWRRIRHGIHRKM